MTLKSAALLALIGTGLLTIVVGVAFIVALRKNPTGVWIAKKASVDVQTSGVDSLVAELCGQRPAVAWDRCGLSSR
jgi:hypothetical protein